MDIYRPYGDGFAAPKTPEDKAKYSHFLAGVNFESLYGTSYSEYLNRLDVRKALNIPTSVTGFSPCSDVNYVHSEEASFWAYPLIKEYGYRVLVYSGDTDAVVTTVGTWNWIDKLGWKSTKTQKNWYLDNKIAGFYHQFEGLDFLIFHGAGHLVPIWLKKESHIAIFSWIDRKPFP